MVVRESAAAMAVKAFSVCFIVKQLYCTVQYMMEQPDYNSVEPAIQGRAKNQVA